MNEVIDVGSMSREIMLLRDAGCPVTIRKIEALEDFMRKMPPREMPVRDFFSNGAYARELFIPKGSLLTGKIIVGDLLSGKRRRMEKRFVGVATLAPTLDK